MWVGLKLFREGLTNIFKLNSNMPQTSPTEPYETKVANDPNILNEHVKNISIWNQYFCNPLKLA